MWFENYLSRLQTLINQTFYLKLSLCLILNKIAKRITFLDCDDSWMRYFGVGIPLIL